MRRPLIAAGALMLVGCPAPCFVSGVVYGRAADEKGAHALVSPIEGATVTWTCPPGTNGPPPQTLKTDYEGRFKSKEYHFDMPETCELVVEKQGFATTRIPFGKLHDPSRSDSKRVVRAAVELRNVTPETPAATGLTCVDLPNASDFAGAPPAMGQPAPIVAMLMIDVTTTEILIDGKPQERSAVVKAVREARAKSPDVRAIVRADGKVPYGDVIGAIDLVRQAGVSKIAFSVTRAQ